MGETEGKSEPTAAETREYCLGVLERCARGEKIPADQVRAAKAWLAETRGLFQKRSERPHPAAKDVPAPLQLADDVTGATKLRPPHVGLSPHVTSRSTKQKPKVPRKSG